MPDENQDSRFHDPKQIFQNLTLPVLLFLSFVDDVENYFRQSEIFFRVETCIDDGVSVDVDTADFVMAWEGLIQDFDY